MDHSLSRDIKMREVAWKWGRVGVALAFGVGGCGGRVDQVNVGKEQVPRDPAMMQGEGGDIEVANPTTRETQAMLTCPMARRTDARFNDAVGSFSPDGSLLTLLGNEAAPLQVLRLFDDSVMSAFEIPESRHYYRAVVSPDNTLVIAAGDAVTVFRVADGALLADVPVSGQAQSGVHALGLDFSHDGQLVATANGSDDTVNIWSVPDLGLVSTISVRYEQFRGVASSVAFSPDDSLVAVATNDGVTLWTVADGSRVWSEGGPLRMRCEGIGEVKFSPDGTELAKACLDGSNGVLSAETGQFTPAFGTASHGVGSVSYYDNDHLLIGDDGVGARLWARDASGVWSPSCLLTSGVPQWGQVSAPAGGLRMYLHVNGGANAAWLFEQAP
jgi:WD40 repeat protein